MSAPFVAVVTGATSGIGKAAALALAEPRTSLIIIGRNERAARRVAERARRRGAACEFVAADFAQPGDVRHAVSRILARHDHVDVLINNAGGRNDAYSDSGFGVERTFAVNHLAHFLLTRLLMEALLAAPAARVITVSSGAHTAADAEEPWHLSRAAFDRRAAYSKSKLANVMFAYGLARRFEGTRATSNSVDPGGVATNFARNNGIAAWLRHYASHAMKRDLATAGHAAETIVYLARSAEVVGISGKHFCRKRAIASSPASYDAEAGRRLWDLSERLTNDPIISSAAHTSATNPGGISSGS